MFSPLVPTLQFPHIKVPENTSPEKKKEETQALITHSASFSSLGGSIWWSPRWSRCSIWLFVLRNTPSRQKALMASPSTDVWGRRGRRRTFVRQSQSSQSRDGDNRRHFFLLSLLLRCECFLDLAELKSVGGGCCSHNMLCDTHTKKQPRLCNGAIIKSSIVVSSFFCGGNETGPLASLVLFHQSAYSCCG